MDIQIAGKQIDIGESLQAYVRDKIVTGVHKYFDRPVDSHVTFSREGHQIRTDCSVHLGTGMVLQVQSEATDIYASFDSAIDRLEKRLRRYKRRLKNHHSTRKDPLPALSASSYVIEQPSYSEDDEPDDMQPVIIAEEQTSVPTMSVGEAVMQMDLNDAPVVVFKGASEGSVNIVYRRPDGHIGWIDTQARADTGKS